MFPILQVGPLAVQTPGLVLLLGLWLGLTLSERFAARRDVDPDLVSNFFLVVLVASVVGARLGYAAMYPAIFGANPLNLLSINLGLFDPWSGLAAGLLSALVFGMRKQLPFWDMLDVLTPAFAVIAAAYPLSQLASGTGYGAPTDLPWGIWLWGVVRHPSQVYALLASLLILCLVWPDGRLGKKPIPGIFFLTFLGLSAFARLVLESFRGDSIFLPGGIRLAQVLAWLVLAGCLWLLRKRIARSAQV